MNRWPLWFLLAIITSALCCGENGDGTNKGKDSDPNSSDADSEISEKGELQIASWWTAPGEAEALQALVDVYLDRYPNISVIDIIGTLGGESDAHAVIAKRIAENNPPDILQEWPGNWHEWLGYRGDADDNRLLLLDDIYESEGWNDKYPPLILDFVTYTDGHKYGVATGLHRLNTLFYNKFLVPEPPSDFESLLTMAEGFQEKGILPFAVSGVNWSAEIFFGGVMAASAGAEFYHAFYEAKVDFSDPGAVATVEKVVDDFLAILQFTNTDEDIEWGETADRIMSGEAAMTIHGDWIKGYMQSLGWMPGIDFGAVAVPGSEALFAYNLDGLSICSGSPNPENALNFMRVAGSAEGQAAFNQAKGSIPLHPDAESIELDPLAQSTLEAYHAATVLHDAPNQARAWTGEIAYGLFHGTMTRDQAISALTK